MNLKKVIAIGIAVSMVTGSSAAAFSGDNEASSTLDIFRSALQEEKEKIMVLESQIAAESNLQMLNDSDDVRVIVELDGDSVIEKATEKGVRISELKSSEVEGIKKKILKEQAKVQKNLDSKGIDFELVNTFTNVTNGFSMETTLEEAKNIEGVNGVKSVTIANEYERPKPEMNHSGEITESSVAWANGYTGEGTIVSIIDTGVDPKHKDMILTDESKAELTENEVNDIISKKSLPGKFFTEKVPYGYNYMDENYEILDLGPKASQHGMHVAGIAGANGDVTKGGIKGTAPEAQLLAMKVFGNNPAMSTTFGDVVIKAIDDSVILGADVINMSLGSTASFVDDNDPEQMAVNRAVDNGVLVAVSAGNSNVFGDGHKLPYAENPDYGLVGSPGLATKSLQVASIENNVMSGYGIEFVNNGENVIYPYTTSGPDMLKVLRGQALKVVDCGLGGTATDFSEQVKGNVALIQRGTYNFAEKITNAQAAGAIGVIVYNNAANGDALLSMSYPESGCNIPAIFMGFSGGTMIKDNSSSDEFRVSFNGNSASSENAAIGKMSGFTSWGTTPDLEFKPEITGVGGNVWSTAQNNEYKNMSGTSMASPNVAGGSALVLQRVDELFNLTGEARVTMAKNILMSTAIPHLDKGENQSLGNVAGANYTSPRRQGAGVMNLAAATETNAIVTDMATGLVKVNLKEIHGDTATFTVRIENFGDDKITYNVDGTVQTDLSDGKNSYLEAQNIIDATTKGFPIAFSSETITVEPKSTVDLMVMVDLSNAVTGLGELSLEQVFVNGGYVEGFVTLTDVEDKTPQLSIPYVGFKGAWDRAPILDSSIYDKERKTFYNFTAMMTPATKAGSYSYLGLSYDAKDRSQADGDFIDISPNSDGSNDSVVPLVSYLRNAKETIVEVINSDGKVVKTLDKIENSRKHYYDEGKKVRSFLEGAKWDGTINGKIAEEGTYTYRIRTKVDFEDAQWQNYDYKVNLDLTAPKLNSVTIDETNETLTLAGEDNFAGHVYAYILKTPLGVKTNSTGVFDISKEREQGYSKKDFEAGITDYARNISVVDLSQPIGAVEGDNEAPIVKLTSPEFFGSYNENTINFAGTVTDKSSVEVVTINGEAIPLTYNKQTGNYEFSINLNFDNGYHSVKIYSKDSAGNELEFAHKIFVDSEAPVLKLEELPAQTIDSSVFIKGTATDNFPNLKVFINGNLIEKIEGEYEYFNEQKPANYIFDNYEIELANGENIINVEIVDGVGYKATKVITVNKVDEIVDEKAPAAPKVERVEGNIVITPVEVNDVEKLEYSYDLETWTEYLEPIPVKEGSTIYARVIDKAGNKSEVTSFLIKDLTPPVKPIITEVNGIVTITANDEDASYLEYSLDGKGWARYTNTISLDEKSTVYARAVDAAGNISEIVEYTVPDKTPPKAPHAYEKDGIITAVATDEDTYKLEYSFDKETWSEYTEPVKGGANTSVYVRAVDAAGNISEIKEVKIPMIITPDPEPNPTPDPATPGTPIIVEKDGLITVTGADNNTVKLEYSLDGKSWAAYIEPVKVSEKATIYVRALNILNGKTAVSDVSEYKVPDRTAPKAPKLTAKNNMVTVTPQDNDVVKIEYSLDNKEWKAYNGPIKLEAKKTMYARVIDDAENVSEVSKITMPASGNSLPQTGGMVGSALMGLGGSVVALLGVYLLRKKREE